MSGCLSCAPYWGPGPQPRHVPWLGIKLVTLRFAGQHSIHWATPARALLIYIPKGGIAGLGGLTWRYESIHNSYISYLIWKLFFNHLLGMGNLKYPNPQTDNLSDGLEGLASSPRLPMAKNVSLTYWKEPLLLRSFATAIFMAPASC